MNTYIYQAELWCEDCAEDIRERLIAEGVDPDDGDSDDFPQGPYPGGGGDADSPNHCASLEDCLNPLDLDDRRIGAFLDNTLTDEGERYVRAEMADNPSSVTEFWGEVYGLEPAFRASKVAMEFMEQAINGNRKDVISELEDMDPLQAAAVAFYLRELIGANEWEALALGDMLSNRVDE